MATPSPARGPARETRLLLLTLGVSVAVLFLLARFRFPERPISDLATPQPLARLARTTTFDDLSATMADLLRRAGETSVTLRVSDPAGAAAGAEADSGGRRLVPALRVRDDLALAVLPGDARVEAIDNEPAIGNVVLARDEVRGLALVRVPARPTPSLGALPQGEANREALAELLALPGFLAVIDAAPGGFAVRAQFVTQVTTRPHPAWDATVFALGGVTNLRPGAMVFTLSGRFIGLVLADGDETIVAPVDVLTARADRLTRGESVLAANAALAVQPLSPMLAKATKASNGVVIAAIEGAVAGAPVGVNAGAGAGSAGKAGTTGTAGAGGVGPSPLRVGDVIAAVDNEDIQSVADWERVIGRRAPGTTVQLRVVRRDGTLRVPLTLRWRDTPLAPGDDGKAAAAASAKRSDANAAALGLSLRVLPNGGIVEVQGVDAGSAAARAGLQTGDRITALPGASTASPSKAPARANSPAAPMATTTPLTVARVETAFKDLPSGDALLLAINRAGQPLVIAIEKP